MFFYHKEPYSVKFGPILRMINDMGDTTKFWGSMDTGVEQVAFSPHRADFMELFHQGGVMEIPLTNSTKFTETSNVEKKFTIRP